MINNLPNVPGYKMRLIKEEVRRAGREMQSYRPEKPFTELELAFGYAAFMQWLGLSLQKQQNNDPDFYEFYEGCNESAKQVAIQYVDVIQQNNAIREALKYHYESFDIQKEQHMADMGALASISDGWENSLTRAVIMICRQLSYFYTGVLGDTFELKGHDISWVELNDATTIWLMQAIDTK